VDFETDIDEYEALVDCWSSVVIYGINFSFGILLHTGKMCNFSVNTVTGTEFTIVSTVKTCYFGEHNFSVVSEHTPYTHDTCTIM